jgi:DNA-directed RNA polymerase specialized sigma24 family protein
MTQRVADLVTFPEISPEMLKAESETLERARLARSNRLDVESLRQELQIAEWVLRNARARCQRRAVELWMFQSMSVAKIAEWLGVSEATVDDWLEAPIEVAVTGGFWK